MVIAPDDANRALLDERGIRFNQEPVTRDNCMTMLELLLTAGGDQGFA